MIISIIWDLNPEIIKFFNLFSIRYYSVLFVIGLLLGYNLLKYICVNSNSSIITRNRFETLVSYILIGIILGARIGHCLFYNFKYYFKNPIEIILPLQFKQGEIKFIGFQGLASHGGALGILLSIFIYNIKNRINILSILDRISIVTPLTAFFIRLGNFANSEIIGKPTNSNYGIIFKRIDLIPRHPTQIYEAIAYLIIFIIIYYIYKYKINITKNNGVICGILLILLFSIRFIIEFLKETYFESKIPLNMGQILSIPFIIVGIILILNNKYACQNDNT
ncbi:MAG: prolipoprotein diacylglyceryl transferase [Candidatus Bostrichicola ureolyticus]|nr:MAG: prolipoprotein diacylglyceryl transferase [Candidatus Bostrichicola ureolyticus]